MDARVDSRMDARIGEPPVAERYQSGYGAGERARVSASDTATRTDTFYDRSIRLWTTVTYCTRCTYPIGEASHATIKADAIRYSAINTEVCGYCDSDAPSTLRYASVKVRSTSEPCTVCQPSDHGFGACSIF